MNPIAVRQPPDRLAAIERARRTVLEDGQPLAVRDWMERDWLEQSWRRCLGRGQRPDARVAFDQVSAQTMRRAAEANHALVQAARPVLERLGRAIADTRYFAILTNARGVVVDVNGPIDRSDRRAHLITRIGVDLSEESVGTAAIGAALSELQPVWLHRGEHFFADTGVYSCAGAPLFGPDGACVGMLDLTGIEQPERPELMHLVTQSARSIETALALRTPHALQVRMNWPGRSLGGDGDGIICLDADGWVTAANHVARQMVPQLVTPHGAWPHASDLFGLPFQMLFDAARRQGLPIEVPLWSGLRLQALPVNAGDAHDVHAVPAAPAQGEQVPLKELETTLIRQAVEQARGNVAQAARTLGISRATVYRKLHEGRRGRGE